MVPYRLRTPVYGGKLKQKKAEDRHNQGDDPLAGGGPLQCAIQSDLLALRSDFLHQVNSSCNGHGKESRGPAFSAFKEVFGENKVALLHTRTIPPRCDRDSYSQLIYATCLDLLKESVNDDEVCFRLDHAAYALFCLYALYETNPLPTGPATRELEMLSLGLQAEENPKHLYRRSFKTPIRIDRQHYLLLQRLRDEAVAKQADCRVGRVKTKESQVSATQPDKEHADQMTCLCGVATDTIHVIDRLIATDSFIMTEYTGPCGLEGLAGHKDYPFGCKRPKKTPKNQQKPEENKKLTDAELDAVGTSTLPTLPFDELSTLAQSYWSQLDAIRSPPTRRTIPAKTGHIQSAIEAVRQHQSSQTLWKEFSRRFSNGQSLSLESPDGDDSQVQAVPTEPTPRPTTQPNHKECSNAVEHQTANMARGGEPDGTSTLDNNSAAPDVPYKVIVPSDLPQHVHGGIHKAFAVLMKREGKDLKARVLDGLNVPELLTHQQGGDEMSSVGYRGAASVSSSIATGGGQLALRELLVSATNPATRLPREPTTVNKTRNTFLTMETATADIGNSDQASDVVSELSSDDDDEVSVAASAVGQKALRKLLATVRDSPMPISKRTTEEKRKAY